MSSGLMQFQLTGLKPTLDRLKGVDEKTRKKTLRKAIGAGTRIMTKAIKRNLPAGLLRKSIGSKIKVYRNSGVVVGIAGPRTGFKQMVTMKDGSAVLQDPSAISHLVEGGRRSVTVKNKRALASKGKVYGKRVAAVAPTHFTKRALESAGGDASAAIIKVIVENTP